MKKILFLVGILAAINSQGVERGEAVVVVYNAQLPESKAVALHYAERRKVPENQVVGLSLPVGEAMSRAEYRDDLEKPLLKFLESKKLFIYGSAASSSKEKNTALNPKLKEARIRYAVLCYGVPSKILRDDGLVEPETEQLKTELRRNEAAVDSELALLPFKDEKRSFAGPLGNPLYGTTNASMLHPTNGILMVARLDGPTEAIARGLVDKAMEAETNGLWGRGYFDVRGVTNEYKIGDDWIRAAADVTARFGFDIETDTKPETFPVDFPMSQIAFYAGWYDQDVSGPFTKPNVEWVPGAIGYHLHSFSASNLRSTNKFWLGPMLASGVTATMGPVDEPYLAGTPDVGTFFARLMFLGFSFGEAAYASQGALSWQTTVVGDPLYRPFRRKHQELHEDLLARKSKLIEWSHLRIVNLNIAQGFPAAEVVAYLEGEPTTKKSAVLLEKLGDIYWAQGKPASAHQCYKAALKLELTPLQKARLEKYVANTAEAAAKSNEKK